LKKTFEILKNNPLFQDIAFSDFEMMIGCLSGRTITYKKNDIILLSGDTVNFIGFILSGGVKIIREDIDGNSTILSAFGVSETFAEVFACADIKQSPITIQASEDSEIMFIDYKRVITACTSSCVFHTKLIMNMLKLIAHKNILLTQKIEILSKRTTREKLLHFFSMQKVGSNKFTIPFNREELARFLCIDRSAMSNELSKMRNEGLIQFQKNTFELL
jgi:CRP-like cAMP-binding protein